MAKIRPLPGWALCKTLEAKTTSSGGILLVTDVDKNVTSEGVAQILEINSKDGDHCPISIGDNVVYRGFLRFCNQVGEMYDTDRNCEYFLLSIDDILAVVSGPATVGLYGEYEIK